MTQEDLLVRIQLIGMKISSLGNQYATDLKLGKKCALKDRNDLIVLEGILQLLQCIDVYNENSNCISNTELDTLLDGVSFKYDICFLPEGSLPDRYRITIDNEIRQTPEGDLRTYY